MEKKSYKLLAAACFAVMALSRLFEYLGGNGFHFWNNGFLDDLLFIIGSGMVVFGLHRDVERYALLGCLMVAVSELVLTIWFLVTFAKAYDVGLFELMGLEGFAVIIIIEGVKTVGSALMVIAFQNRGNAKTFARVSAGAWGVAQLIRIVYCLIEGTDSIELPTYPFFVMVLAMLSLGVFLEDPSQRENKAVPAQQSEEHKEDSYEKLEKLKAYLDDEVITQEEFDEKKKQILGF